jgi:hypothetical protein
MPAFPTLRTGAVLQYPATRTIEYSSDIVQFMDGSEQRFRISPAPCHRWSVTLALLDEIEIQQIRSFIAQLNGASGTFGFTDPWDGILYPSCSIEGDSVADSLAGPYDGRTSFTIRENP